MNQPNSPHAEKLKQLVQAGHVKPPAPPQIRKMYANPEFKLLVEAIKKDSGVYFELMKNPDSLNAQKLTFLRKLGYFRPPAYPEEFAKVLKQEKAQRFMKNFQEDPSFYHQVMKNPKHADAKLAVELVKFGVIRVPPPSEVLALLKEKAVQEEYRKINQDPSYYFNELSKNPESEISKKIEILIKHNLIDPRWILEETRLKILAEKDEDARRIFSQDPFLPVLYKQTVKDPLILLTQHRYPEWKQVIRFFRDLGLFPQRPKVFWRFDDNLVKIIEELKTPSAEKIRQVLADKDFMTDLMKFQARKVTFSDFLKNPDHKEKFELLVQSGVFVMKPVKNDSHLEIDFALLKKTPRALEIVSDFHVRRIIGQYCDAVNLFEDITQDPEFSLKKEISELKELGVLLTKRNYGEYKWTVNIPPVPPAQAVTFLDDKELVEVLENSLREDPGSSTIFEHAKYGRAFQYLREVGILKEVPICQKWIVDESVATPELKELLKDKEFAVRIKHIQLRPLVVYKYMESKEFAEKVKKLQDAGVIKVSHEPLVLSFRLFQPGPKQAKREDINKIFNDINFLKLLYVLQKDPRQFPKDVPLELFNKQVLFLIQEDLIEVTYVTAAHKSTFLQHEQKEEDDVPELIETDPEKIKLQEQEQNNNNNNNNNNNTNSTEQKLVQVPESKSETAQTDEPPPETEETKPIFSFFRGWFQ